VAPNIPHIRRWFGIAAIALALVVAGVYLYRRWRLHHLAQAVPGKIDVQIRQAAEGFTISKSEAGRTLFTVRAGKAIQYKQGGRAELHDVTITVYGRDSQRFDQIYGADFEYDPLSGIVAAKGEVQIDLETNPEGLENPDQTRPKEFKNPIHVKVTGLLFDQKTGNAETPGAVEFRVAEAYGSAVGASYHAREGVLNLKSKVNLVLTNGAAATLNATRAVIHREPRQIDFENPQVVRGRQHFDADQISLFLRPNSTIERAIATGNIRIHPEDDGGLTASAERAELLTERGQNNLQTVTFSGGVQVKSGDGQALQGDAGRVTLKFTGKNVLSTALAESNVRIVQQPPQESSVPGSQGAPQALEVDAPAIDFAFAPGGRLRNATTSGAAQILIAPVGAPPNQGTVITAGKFNAEFDARNRLKSTRVAPEARIVNRSPGQPDRVSTSDSLDASFRPAGGIESIVQRGHVAYVDASLHASGEEARYVPADHTLYLSGSPRVVENGMTTTAQTMRINRATGEAFAEGDVKSTYSSLQPQPDGALLASSDPIHVTARSVTTHRSPAVATYTGDARLWQRANVIEAPTIEFNREQRTVVARAEGQQRVSTAFVQSDAQRKQTPVAITSEHLSYADKDRKARFEGHVVVKSADVTVTANQIDAYLRSRGTAAGSPNPERDQPSQLERIVADGNVQIVEAQRRAQGNHLVYTASEEKFVLTGGPPSIFDAEHGKVTGSSLTFYKRDDRVLVEGEAGSPTTTQTRVAR
jgi:lipopolysaccharide export system protein LptA